MNENKQPNRTIAIDAMYSARVEEVGDKLNLVLMLMGTRIFSRVLTKQVAFAIGSGLVNASGLKP